MTHLGRIIWIALAGLAPLCAHAQIVFYGVDTSSTLYRIDPQTQIATNLGSATYLEGLAFSPTGQLFGTDVDGALYSINLTTGAATAIGSTGRNDIEALTFVGQTLVGATFSSTPTLFSIDPATGATTDIVAVTSLTGATRAMTAVDSNTVLLAADGSQNNNSLYSINLTTGTATLIGSMPMTGQFLAMGLASNGVLYGFGNAGEVWTIDPLTAQITQLGSTGSQFWLDATFAPVPEPSTWALLASGMLLVFGLRRRAA